MTGEYAWDDAKTWLRIGSGLSALQKITDRHDRLEQCVNEPQQQKGVLTEEIATLAGGSVVILLGVGVRVVSRVLRGRQAGCQRMPYRGPVPGKGSSLGQCRKHEQDPPPDTARNPR